MMPPLDMVLIKYPPHRFLSEKMKRDAAGMTREGIISLINESAYKPASAAVPLALFEQAIGQETVARMVARMRVAPV